MSLWEQCDGKKYIKRINAESWRIVEAQHILNSRDLVDSREEHDLLEELLEESKPPVNKDKHYLIFTPFRYPPLKYGSRFGRMYEPALWYGSLEREVAFAEVAYYRLKFFKDCEGELGYIKISMTAFTAFLSTESGIDLTSPPFAKYSDKISHGASYEYSQALGTAMREAHIDAFLFFSARTKREGKNVAAFIPEVFIKKKNQYINKQQNWVCIANKMQIEFTRLEMLKQERLAFSADYFDSI